MVSRACLLVFGTALCLTLAQSPDLRGLIRLRTLPDRSPEQVIFNPQGTVLATADRQSIRLWEVSSGKLLRTLQERVQSLAFSRDGKTLVGASGNTIYRWDSASGKPLPTRSIQGRISRLALNSDGSRLTTVGHSDGGLTVLEIWDTVYGQKVRSLGIPSREQYSGLGFSQGGRYMGVLKRGAVQLFETATGTPGPSFGDGRTSLSSVAFSPDGKHLAALTYTRTSAVKIWEIASGQEVGLIEVSDNNRFASLAFSHPDGRFIATGLYNGTVQLWDSTSANLLRTLQVTERIAVGALSFSPEGKRLATGFSGGISLWGTPDAAAVFGRKLTVTAPVGKPLVLGPRPGQVYALVVGITNYKSGIASLSYAFEDARRLSKALTDPTRGNLPEGNVRLRGEDEATKNLLLADLRDLAKRLKAGDTLIFYFSGHGMPGSEGQAKLIPIDALPSDEETWLALSEVQATVQKASNLQGKLVLILDACFSGQAEEGSRSFSISGRRAVSELQPIATTEQSTVLASSDGTQPSWEEAQLGGGVFTHYLLEALSKGDANQDGYVSLGEAIAYVAPRVEGYSTIKGKAQTPRLRGPGEFALGANASVLAQKNLDQRLGKLGALKRDNQLGGEQFDALAILIGKSEPEDVKDYLAGSLNEADFLLLVRAGAITKVPADKSINPQLLKLGTLRASGKLRRDQFLALNKMVAQSSGPPDLWDYLAGRISEAQFLSRLRAGGIAGVER